MALLMLINEQKHICLVVSHISSRKGVGLRIKKGLRFFTKGLRIKKGLKKGVRIKKGLRTFTKGLRTFTKGLRTFTKGLRTFTKGLRIKKG